MIKITLTNYERNDLIRILDYALESFRKEYKNHKINSNCFQDAITRIDVLRRRAGGEDPKVDYVQFKEPSKELYGRGCK